jgi:adenylosuccinate lyase
VPFGHALVAFASLARGFARLSVMCSVCAVHYRFQCVRTAQLNKARVAADLDGNWEVLSEAVQTILRREQFDAPYEHVKTLTR